MTEPHRAAPSAARRVAWLAGAIVVASVLFAPFSSAGFCADAPAADQSYCATTVRSPIGLETSLWLWLGATVVLGVLAWWLSARVRPPADTPRRRS
jgi:hypothetical protein